MAPAAFLMIEASDDSSLRGAAVRPQSLTPSVAGRVVRTIGLKIAAAGCTGAVGTMPGSRRAQPQIVLRLSASQMGDWC